MAKGKKFTGSAVEEFLMNAKINADNTIKAAKEKIAGNGKTNDSPVKELECSMTHVSTAKDIRVAICLNAGCLGQVKNWMYKYSSLLSMLEYVVDTSRSAMKTDVEVVDSADGQMMITATTENDGSSSVFDKAADCLTDVIAIIATVSGFLKNPSERLISSLMDYCIFPKGSRLIMDNLAMLFGDNPVMLASPKYQCSNDELVDYIRRSLSLDSLKFKFYGNIFDEENEQASQTELAVNLGKIIVSALDIMWEQLNNPPFEPVEMKITDNCPACNIVTDKAVLDSYDGARGNLSIISAIPITDKSLRACLIAAFASFAITTISKGALELKVVGGNYVLTLADHNDYCFEDLNLLKSYIQGVREEFYDIADFICSPLVLSLNKKAFIDCISFGDSNIMEIMLNHFNCNTSADGIIEDLFFNITSGDCFNFLSEFYDQKKSKVIYGYAGPQIGEKEEFEKMLRDAFQIKS